MTPPTQSLTDAEFAVLEAIWQGGPQTIRQLTDRLYPKGTTAHYATTQKLLDRLEDKQCVSRDRSQMTHVFQATVKRGDLIDASLQEMAEKLCDGSLTPVLTHLVQGSQLSDQERETLRELLGKLKQKKRTPRKGRS